MLSSKHKSFIKGLVFSVLDDIYLRKINFKLNYNFLIDSNHKAYAKKVLSEFENKFYKDPENPYGVDRSKENDQTQFSNHNDQKYEEYNTEDDFYKNSSGNYITAIKWQRLDVLISIDATYWRNHCFVFNC